MWRRTSICTKRCRPKTLPPNYITKGQANKLGWKTKGSLDQVAPGKSIGGDRYGNYEKKLPDKQGRTWKECDIDYVRGNRNAKRICFSNDGLIYYTSTHYQKFERLCTEIGGLHYGNCIGRQAF